MAVGLPLKVTYANGDVYSASDVNDTNGTINANATPYAAGKNKIINGDFNVWQRGTTFTVTGTESVVYKADRWSIQADGTTTTRTISRQAFTPGTAPVAGYEGNFFLRYAQTTAGNNSYNFLTTRIENVTSYAGQAVTLSFWAKADAARTVTTSVTQNFGSGGSGSVSNGSQSNSLTTSWQRFTSTFTMASIAGKTIGTSSFLEVTFTLPNGAITPTIDFWGVQLENGSTATPFQTATGTIQGELAACQRYYYRSLGNTGNAILTPYGMNFSTTLAYIPVQLPVQMRVKPSSVEYASIELSDFVAEFAISAVTLDAGSTPNIGFVQVTSTGLTQYRPNAIRNDNNAAGYIGFSAEL
jgi:hypothetical protein